MPAANALPKAITVIETSRQMSLIRFSPSGRFLLSAGRDRLIHRWDFAAMMFPPADALVPSKSSDPPASPLVPELPALAGHDGWVTQVAFDPQSRRFFTTDSWGRLIGWNATTEPPTPVWNLPAAHNCWIRNLAVSPNGEQVATCGMDKAIRLWSASDGKLLREFAGQPDEIYSLAFHPDGKSLVAGDLKGIVRQFDLATNTVAREFDAKVLYLYDRIQDVGGVRVLAFDAAGKTLAAAGIQPTSGGFVQGGALVKFFDWESGKELQTLKLGDNNLGFAHDLAWHPAGYWIGVCSGQPGQGDFFLHRTGEEQPFFVQALPNCHSIALHPDGSRFAVIANAGPFGQMKSMAREGMYPGNTSPIHLFELTAPL